MNALETLSYWLEELLGGLLFGGALLLGIFWLPCAIAGHGLADHPVLGEWLKPAQNTLPPTYEEAR